MSSNRDEAFQRLVEYIESQLEFPTSHYNEDYLKRRIESRMRRTGSDTFSDYLKTLHENPREQKELLDTFSINVTEFFRNNVVWDRVRRVLRTLTDNVDGTINIWSAACADGREPYSVALMAAADNEIDDTRLDILATDINETALKLARTATYETTMTEDIPSQLSYMDNPSEYVRVSDNIFQLPDSITDMVTFEKHDLVHGEQKSGFDLVLCRNLLIYINSKYERKILKTVYDALRPAGYLIIGKSETIPPDLLDNFEPVDNRQRVYYAAKDSPDDTFTLDPPETDSVIEWRKDI